MAARQLTPVEVVAVAGPGSPVVLRVRLVLVQVPPAPVPLRLVV